MTGWIEWSNLGLGIVGAVGTVGIFILVWQWWIDSCSKQPYKFLDLSTSPIAGGTFYNVYVKAKNRASHSLRFMMAVQERCSLQLSTGEVRQEWVSPPQQVTRDAAMKPVEKGIVDLDAKDIGDIRIRVEKIPGSKDPEELRLLVTETISWRNPSYWPLPKRV